MNTHTAPGHSLLSVHSNSIRWHTLMSPSAASIQNATGFLRPGLYVKHGHAQPRIASSPRLIPFYFATSAQAHTVVIPSQVRTKWVTRGGSQLEQAQPYIRYLLDFCLYLGLRTDPEYIRGLAGPYSVAHQSLTVCGPFFHACMQVYTHTHTGLH